MLVITRREQEGVVIYDEGGAEVARVSVAQASQGKVKLCLTAPSHVKFLRDELINGYDKNNSGTVAPNLRSSNVNLN